MALTLYILGMLLVFVGMLKSKHTTRLSLTLSVFWPILSVLAAIAFLLDIKEWLLYFLSLGQFALDDLPIITPYGPLVGIFYIFGSESTKNDWVLVYATPLLV